MLGCVQKGRHPEARPPKPLPSAERESLFMTSLPMMLISFALYYLILFVICFLVVNQGQDALYDEAPPGAGWKVALGSLLLAAMLTWTRSSFATMFTDDITKTTLQAILWFGVFTLIFRFHPWHALGIGLGTMIISSVLATMAVQSMLERRPAERFESKAVSTPIRRPVYSAPPVSKSAPAAK